MKLKEHRRVIVLSAAACICAAAVATAIAVEDQSPDAPVTAGASQQQSAGAGATGSSTTSSAPVIAKAPVLDPALAAKVPKAVGVKVVGDVTDTLDDALAVATEIDKGAADEPLVSDAVSGALLNELDAERIEFDSLGWTRTGAVTLEDVTVTGASPKKSPTTVRVAACVDLVRPHDQAFRRFRRPTGPGVVEGAKHF